jgi:ribosome-associated GTPase EngA
VLDEAAAEAARWDAALAAEADTSPAAIAFVGRPNVGKSSLLNALLGEERTIVSDVPGTTRDAIDTRLAWGRSEIVLIDTAGIRRRGKVASGPSAERYSTMRALTALSRADVAVLVIDAVEGLTSQDAHVAGYAVEEGKGLVLAVNKWDLVEDKTDRTFDQYVEWIRNDAPFLEFAPVVSISAKTHQRIGRVLELAVDIWAERRKRVPTGELNRMLMAATARTRKAPETLLRHAGRDLPADIRVLRIRCVIRAFLVPAIPREPSARDIRVPRNAGPPRLQGSGLGQTAEAAEAQVRAVQDDPTVST